MSSIASMALRMAARRLLDNTTLAGTAIYDSAIAPIDNMVGEGETAPFIVISSEDEVADTTGRDVLSGTRQIDLVFEIAIAARLEGTGKPGEEGAAAPEIVIPATDAGLEISIALIARQMMHSLFETRGGWGEFFKVMIPNVKQVTSRRGVGNKEGARFAARQIILTCDTLDDPPFGVDQKGRPDAWGNFITLIEADSEFSALAPLIRATIEGTPIAEWDRERSATGLSDAAAGHMGFAAVQGASEAPAAPLDEATPVLDVVTFEEPAEATSDE